MSGPVSESERIVSMDVLRGFALLGILMMNIQSFAMISAAYLNPSAYGDFTGANFWVWAITHVFTDTKFISLFSMLFGAGIVLMWQRAEERGASATRLHYRRMGWLILFGILHAHLLWYGDILYTYGVCGLIVYLFRKKSPRSLITTALVLALVGSMLWIVAGLSMRYWPGDAIQNFEVQGWKPQQQSIQEEIADYRGSWLDQMSRRPIEAFGFQVFISPVFIMWRTTSMMLIGMALFKRGALHALWSRREYLSLVAAGAFAGVPLAAFGIFENLKRNWELSYSFFFGSQYNYWASYLVALGWVGVIMLWCQTSRLPGLKARVASVGRMAFSNYILQTVICTTIFYGHGFALFGTVERAGQALIVLAIYGTQLMIAPIWLKRFWFGPLEWMWRTLTYGKRQPFRRQIILQKEIHPAT
jgi:uncharacterized protein